MTPNEVVAVIPALTRDDIRAALAFAADRGRVLILRRFNLE
jgi:uncharacterized protein (DUF433 family)